MNDNPVHAAYHRMMAAEARFTDALQDAFGARSVEYRYELDKRQFWPQPVRDAHNERHCATLAHQTLCQRGAAA